MIEWTEENSKVIKRVNREVNHNIEYKTDAKKYPDLEVPEYWEIIIGRGFGDCDDYALTKRAQLRELFPDHKNSFRLATCWTQDKEYHAVLIVDTTDGAFLLDNNFDEVRRWSSVGYEFHKVQTANGKGWEKLS